MIGCFSLIFVSSEKWSLNMSYNKKIIITGFALILSAIALKQSDFSIILVGLGLVFVIAGCFCKDKEE